MFGGTFAGTFEEVLPFLRNAWDETIQAFEDEMCRFPAAPGVALTRMLVELTDPDPHYRGNPKDRVVNPYSLHRYVSELDLICKRHQFMRGIPNVD